MPARISTEDSGGMAAKASTARTQFDETDLRRLAGGGTVQRALQLLADGHIRKLDVHKGRVTATVEGTDVYRVELWGGGKDLGYKCTCESSADGSVCEHMVAAGLAAVAGTATLPKPPAPAVTKDDVRTHLLTLDKEKLVDILLLRAEWDPQLRDQLFVEAAKGRSSNGALDVRALRESIDRATETGGYIDWRGAHSFAMGVEHAVDALVELFEQGHDDVLELVEHALKRAEDATCQVQDDGDMGPVLDRLAELHLGICTRARPEPVALAKRLFEWELMSPMGLFHDCAEKYAEVLGEAGLAEYQQLAELAWKNVPALGPGQKDVRDCRRHDLTRIMVKLAEKEGVDAVVEVLKKDLSTPSCYLRIAETYRKAGSRELAVRWAEKGIAAFPKSPDRRLQGFLAEEYQRGGRGGTALELAWKEFVERPSLDGYAALKKRAEENECWAEWKEKALEHIATLQADRSLVVKVLLFERDVDGALREAHAGGCGEAEWMQLADALEKNKPGEAAAIYAARIDTMLEYTDNDRYRLAVRHLQKIKALFEEAGEANKFAPVLEGVKKKYGRRSNLMRMLERARW